MRDYADVQLILFKDNVIIANKKEKISFFHNHTASLRATHYPNPTFFLIFAACDR